MAGLYIHVPFCGSICSYCHFARTAEHDRPARERFVDGVLAEFALRRQACGALDGGRRLETAYVGGGTPSQLEPDLVARLAAGTVGALPGEADLEFTVEANPETFSDEVAAAWRDVGANRVSLGVQSLDPAVLDRLGRDCAPETARRALARASLVFSRVSADWILAPGTRTDTLHRELAEAVDLGVEHVSLYILELHAGTVLAREVAAGRLRPDPDHVVEAAYLACVEHLSALGLEQYEVSNFARPGAESRHNGAYWRGVPWLGLGPGAHGCWGRQRYGNCRDLDAWLARLDRGELPVATVDRRDPRARRLERLILGLRTADGVPLSWLPAGAVDLERGRQEGLWTTAGPRLVLTPRGFLHLDTLEEALARRLD